MHNKVSIHGRFQPFHNAHLAYAMAALAVAEKVYIGLTRVLTEPGIGGEIAPHRLELQSNPLSYYQRTQIITRALLDAGVSPSRFDVGPFPIEKPDRLKEFWPLHLPCCTTVVDAWNTKKISVLREIGYEVVVMRDIIKPGLQVATGTKIRELIRSGDESWVQYVPPSVPASLKLLDAVF
ncbi:hypothetical protein [Roseomonas chloroacetimidivorans]|uniref:hypothetical protein n=1 Tax=Roseomonas chloroacetimidivorans TaxID=1766656 RepID=UPI003C75BD32